VSIPDKLGLVGGEVFQEQSRQVTILSQVQQVLHMERIDPVLRIVVKKLIGDEEGFMGVWSAQAVESETTGKTSNRPEETFESLGHVVRDEIFVDLHHGDQGLFRIRQRRFSTDANQFLVVDHPAIASLGVDHGLGRFKIRTQRLVD